MCVWQKGEQGVSRPCKWVLGGAVQGGGKGAVLGGGKGGAKPAGGRVRVRVCVCVVIGWPF